MKSKDFYRVNTALEDMKKQLNLFGEIKWTKVTAPYLEKYKQMMDVFFGFVKDKKLKMRVMFQETSQIVSNHETALQYHLLYYQFIKHAFGLAYHRNNPSRPTKIKLFFDEIPDTRLQNDDFKDHKSLDAILRNSPDKVSRAMVFCRENLFVEDKITYYPLYMAMFL